MFPESLGSFTPRFNYSDLRPRQETVVESIEVFVDDDDSD